MPDQLLELVFIDRKIASESVHIQFHQTIVSKILGKIKTRPFLVLYLHKALDHAVKHVQLLSFETSKV